jgi:hypothetical protein
MQKRASGGATEPQEGQRRSSAVPQDMQKRAWSGFSVPQVSQARPAITHQGYAIESPNPGASKSPSANA